MNTSIKKAATVAMVAVFGLLGRGGSFVSSAHAQTATGTVTSTATDTAVTEATISDFIRELQALLAKYNTDITAQKISKEILGEENKHAGDQFGTNTVIDGEKPENEIEQEIDHEVDTESPESEKRDESEHAQIREGEGEGRDNASSTEQLRSGGGDRGEQGGERNGENGGQSEGESNN